MINNFVQRIFLTFFMIVFFSCEKNHGKIFNQNDIWIKNGAIVDGTGSKMFFSDIVINGDSISYIGKVLKEINAKKLDKIARFVALLLRFCLIDIMRCSANTSPQVNKTHHIKLRKNVLFN